MKQKAIALKATGLIICNSSSHIPSVINLNLCMQVKRDN